MVPWWSTVARAVSGMFYKRRCKPTPIRLIQIYNTGGGRGTHFFVTTMQLKLGYYKTMRENR